MRRPIRIVCFVAAVALAAVPVRAAPDDGKDVTLKTDDNMKIAATWWGNQSWGAAGVVLVHMEGSDRNAWKPVVPHLAARGVQVIALDLRGHGGSTKQNYIDLSKRADAKDAKLFAEMHRDVIAAVRHLVKQGKCDKGRVVVCGAGAGASVALDAARRYPGETAAVLCMSPSANACGLDAAELLKTFPKDAALHLLVHRDEEGDGAILLHEAAPASVLVTYDDAKPANAAEKAWAHGTRMFGRVPLVEQTVASFAAAKSGSTKDDVVLDGVVAGDAGEWAKSTKVVADGVEGFAYRIGRRVEFGGRVRGKRAAVRVDVMTYFAPGTFPGFTTSADLGWPELGAADAETGTWTWVEPFDSGQAGHAKAFALRVRPSIRVQKTDDGFTFEGEWVTDFGDGPNGAPVDPAKVAIAFEPFDAPPPKPEQFAPGALKIEIGWADAAVAIPSR